MSGLINHMARIIKVPVVCQDAPLSHHVPIKVCAGIRCQDMISGGRDCIFNAPLNGTSKHILVIFIQAKYKTPVDQNTQRMKSLHSLLIILLKILLLVALPQVFGSESFEADKKTAQAGSRGLFDKIAP